ncbi:hypothetical protein [Peptostreptococcus faecalis]|uniref:hypothetical protein n=1 Tax=Peptostreptococcus faecalis TaxID=2045015 RepID=UPI000C7DF8A5|nr:hypothetical protein [Peptostreptococcus faecalis]
MNLHISLGERHYKVEFDLQNKDKHIEEHIFFLTSDKLLIGSLFEGKEIIYQKENTDIYFPEISDRISQL